MSDPQTNPRDPAEAVDFSTSDQGVLDSVLCWVRENWNEESNIGKARLAAVAALGFLLLLSFWPARDVEQETRLPRQAQVDIPAPPVLQSEPAGLTGQVDGTATAEQLVQPLEPQAPSSEAPAAEEDSISLEQASRQAADAYSGYEAGIAALAEEKNQLVRKLEESQVQAGEETLTEAEQQARQVYDEYESRVAQLTAEKRSLEKEGPQTEQALQSATEQASEAYTNYEERVAMLEREKRTLSRQLEDARTALEQTQQELADLKQELEQVPGEPLPPTAVEELGQEMKKQLESIQSLIDRLLQGTGNDRSDEPAQVQPL